jgi:hypothetical protein
VPAAQAVAESAQARMAAMVRTRFRRAREAGFRSRIAGAGPVPGWPE